MTADYVSMCVHAVDIKVTYLNFNLGNVSRIIHYVPLCVNAIAIEVTYSKH